MKFSLLATLGLALVGGCAGSADSGRVAQFDAFHPGGPVYQPQEIVAEKPLPAEAPYGTFFEESKAVPAHSVNPYWIRGYWAWKNGDWEWIPACWVECPRPGLIWINARAYTSGPHTYWQTGYWE